MRRLAALVAAAGLLAALESTAPAGASASTSAPETATVTVQPAVAATHAITLRHPTWAKLLPADTTQVVRTVTSRRWCAKVYCTVTQAWRRNANGSWTRMRQLRSTIGSAGWGKKHEGDDRSPVGVYKIKVTFTTTSKNPGHMPWRRRWPTSIVSDARGTTYNTWIEVPGVTSGDRPSMRSGWVVDYNHVRLRRGVGPAPVQGKGSGIFYHTSKPGHPWAPTEGCTQVGNPTSMRWLLTWLRPGAHPRIVQDR